MRCRSCRHDNPVGARFCIALRHPPGDRLCRVRRRAPGGRALLSGLRRRDRADAAHRGAGAPPPTPTRRATSPSASSPRARHCRASASRSPCSSATSPGPPRWPNGWGPEAMHDAARTASSRLALAEIHRYEGTVNQFLGDGFMALFGAPLAHEDHARRAAARRARRRPERSRAARARRRHRGPELAVRMGLNTGPRGGRRHRRQPANGLHRRRRHARNLAARLRAARGPGQRSS